MNKSLTLSKIRTKLKEGKSSIGSWLQISDTSVSEIMANSGYEWLVIDLEHGSISLNQIPDLCRSIELSGCLPLARLPNNNSTDCSNILDAGVAGIIIPNIIDENHLKKIISSASYPPSGMRGVGYSRANLFGANIESYMSWAQKPFIVAQIENILAIDNLKNILDIKGLDAVLIGPYDLSASMGITGDFNNINFKKVIKKFSKICKEKKVPYGTHIINPSINELKKSILDGYQFVAYSTDAYMLYKASKCPIYHI